MEEGLVVKEILLTGMGYKNSKPLLFAMVDQDLLIYEAFKYNEGIIDGNLNLRFKKVPCLDFFCYNQGQSCWGSSPDAQGRVPALAFPSLFIIGVRVSNNENHWRFCLPFFCSFVLTKLLANAEA